ncbi:MAG: glycerol-3-phosphate 1-O-acyltransferase PlsY [Synechococcus sp. SB0668_bin_15]|nr:glycerol-3-phosphate 1-O-acyltransferase PlsY [Synechococcus sp. SB0668_bin_15]MXZ83025.1 glycerol-3-phosphate 1-O-acyltransferase PlsY [Synechococcus sp. SB0666_bin_14]MYC48998.1 glycerol-3-phosphate 1-O-acyltransferase PlsY [Synechococcus sp. SB0662_bin_14]MYG46191.1 glycerol-3-phosphate 1-O-acyltransferase PlsY [Synechococcus sp. SB0675_bin_6]MYJ59586.1 glycerol-3-phosphate 1-O-acyltransferase PlsY [Synechococcus sp. SB0672_bin_6]MYK92141.1 glycerol-3-phosphate 1-O-acyltransferase PlsY [
MNSEASWLLCLLAAYGLGSIPAGWLVVKGLRGVDLRQQGSGSTGATNVLRVAGRWPALAVLLVDVGKGTVAVLLTKGWGATPWQQLAVGLCALAGHSWPLWLGFRGGKAVATGLGILLGLAPAVALACLGSFLLVLASVRMVSVASLTAGGLLPLLMVWGTAGSAARLPYTLLAMATTVLVVWRHRGNIKRISTGQEPRLGQKAP